MRRATVGALLNIIVCTAVGCLSPGASEEKSSSPEKLNVVVILIDDLGWKDTTCYGSTFYETPNIDRLARWGMKFTDAYAAAPVCSPTRASILTGKYPARLPGLCGNDRERG